MGLYYLSPFHCLSVILSVPVIYFMFICFIRSQSNNNFTASDHTNVNSSWSKTKDLYVYHIIQNVSHFS